MKKNGLILVCLLLLTAGMLFAGGQKAAEDQSLVIHWAMWEPANYLQELSNIFAEESGIDVVVEQTPWETFVQKYNVEMVAKSDAWDIIIGDSQDIGTMAVGNHYVELTDWIKEKGVDKAFTPASMEAYAEYPKGSGKYWAVPAEGDCLGWAYRKDLFEDPANMAAFQAEYGYKLDIPRDWMAMLDIAEFFHDPDNGFYGIAIYGDNGYDSLAMFAEQVIWSFGGDLGNYSTYQVEGILNSQGSIDGVEYYKALFGYTPPAFGDAFFIKANDAFAAGIVPMACNYFAFLPGLANSATNEYADVTGYFPCPPQKGRDGKTRQFSALGGQGASAVTYSKKQDLIMKWLDWFIKEDTQMTWAKLGGYTCHADVLESQEFLTATPYNEAFAVSLNIMKDWWAEPEYAQLLEGFSKNVGAYIIRNEGTAKVALDKTAAEWTKIFDDAGYY